MFVGELYRQLKSEIDKVIYGQSTAIDFALAALFSSGHLLLEGPPGTAKTLLVRTIATAAKLSYQRVQMTADLLPSDVTGSSVYVEDTREFEFKPGPIFTNFLLADEINRASSRTQSALLEAMQENSVTYGSKTFRLPAPFVTFATQNPLESEGTYPLPLAQLDRFMFKVIIDYPSSADEIIVLTNHHATAGESDPQAMNVTPVVDGDALIAARKEIRQTNVREDVVAYVQRLLKATREDEHLSVGASPRAGLLLLMAAKGFARFADRDFVVPDDIQYAFVPTMRHRIVLSPESELAGMSADDALGRVLEAVEVPR